jgi:hypothetical protein
MLEMLEVLVGERFIILRALNCILIVFSILQPFVWRPGQEASFSVLIH